jgi:anaerobic selenocysteine-containing dehydrogenase
VRKHFEDPERPGEKMTVDHYFKAAFENVPGLKDAAEAEGLDALEFMRRKGAFHVDAERRLAVHETEVGADDPGVEIDGVRRRGFNTPSRKLELWSQMLADWGWPEHALPGAIESHVAKAALADDEVCLVPTFRLPVLIHSRSGNAKWLTELAHSNPLLIHPDDAGPQGLELGDLARVETRIGSFVLRVWVTEGIRPGVIACSHHLGRWRKLGEESGEGADPKTNRWSAAPVRFTREGTRLLVRRQQGLEPFDSPDGDSDRLWWKEVGVHQNMTFPVQPDPMSGMHCWHQVVKVKKAAPDDQEGDVRVDLAAAREAYKDWLGHTRPGPGPGGLRRPLQLKRPLAPKPECFYVPGAEGAEA